MATAPHECPSCRGVLGAHTTYCALEDPSPPALEAEEEPDQEAEDEGIEVVGNFSMTELVPGSSYAVIVPDDVTPSPEFVQAIKTMFDAAKVKGYILDGCLFVDLTEEDANTLHWYERGYNDAMRNQPKRENTDG